VFVSLYGFACWRFAMKSNSDGCASGIPGNYKRGFTVIQRPRYKLAKKEKKSRERGQKDTLDGS
jgi:hypothetical protein